MNSNEYREQRAKAIANARVIVDGAAERELTAEEQATVDALFKSADEAQVAADNAERKEKLASAEAELRSSQGRKVQPGKLATFDTISERDRKDAFRAWAMYGTGRVDSNLVGKAAHAGINAASRSMEFRALAKTTSNISVPSDFLTTYEKKLAYFFPILGAVHTFTTENGNDLPLYQADDTGNSASIVGEASSIGVASDPSFSKVTFKAWKYASPIVKVSLEVLQDSIIDIESYLGEAFGERFGRGYETAVVSTNAGSAAPEGLLNGLTVAANLVTGNPLTLAKLIDLETSVDIAYRSQPGAGWMLHDGTWAAVRKLADDNNFPIFLGDLHEGTQPRLLGYPVYISNRMTSIASPGDNAPLIAFGAFKNYHWRQVSNRVLTRLDELYAATGEVGFVMLERADGRYAGHAGSVKTLNSFDSP